MSDEQSERGELFCEQDHLLHNDIGWYVRSCLWTAEQYLSGNETIESAKLSLGHIGINPNRLSFWVAKYRDGYPATWFTARGLDSANKTNPCNPGREGV